MCTDLMCDEKIEDARKDSSQLNMMSFYELFNVSKRSCTIPIFQICSQFRFSLLNTLPYVEQLDSICS